MTYWNAVLLGLVQGVAEFLPISSSGHLAVLQNFLAIGDMENHMLFDVLLHLGTLAAVILAFWKDVREVVTEFARMLHIRRTPRGMKPNRRERRLISFLIIATLPLIPAAFLSNVVESLYQNTFFIGFAFILTGFLLFAADRMGHGNQGRAELDNGGRAGGRSGTGGRSGAGAVALRDDDQLWHAARL